MRADWSKDNLSKVVSKSISKKDVLKKLGLRFAGSNCETLNKYISIYGIDTSHFVKNYYKIRLIKIGEKKEMSDILVENSNFSRTHLKERLFKEGLLKRECCLCGQNEDWNGLKMSLIIDHKNGIYNDNRIENLRIVCPNCNATLDTFAGRNSKVEKKKYYCGCGSTKTKNASVCKECSSISKRKVIRPEYEDLIKDVSENGYSSVGRKYGVSDNAIRKWIKNN